MTARQTLLYAVNCEVSQKRVKINEFFQFESQIERIHRFLRAPATRHNSPRIVVFGEQSQFIVKINKFFQFKSQIKEFERQLEMIP